jgi:hypothetical protein
MKRSDLTNAYQLKPLTFPAREVPHIVIEPNLTCNMRCRRCYNLHHDLVKPLEQVKTEIDLAVSKRNLDTVSLLGGEPTLHPDIASIVAYIKSRNLVCQILTNGLAFYNDPREELLNRLIAAGVDRILLHADVGQERPGIDLDAFREAVFEQFERRAVFFGLSVTVYPESRRTVSALMKHYAHYRFFDGILVTITGDARTSVLHGQGGDDEPTLHEEHDSIARDLGIEPSAYIPSSADDSHVRWLLYFYYLNYRTGATFSLSPRFGRIFRKVFRILYGRHFFAMTPVPSLFAAQFLCVAVIELFLNPVCLRPLMSLLKGRRGFDAIRFHYIVVQSAPQRDEKAGRIEICHHCPDATIRNGKLTPVCLADRINPVPFEENGNAVNHQLRETVFEHLEETDS